MGSNCNYRNYDHQVEGFLKFHAIKKIRFTKGPEVVVKGGTKRRGLQRFMLIKIKYILIWVKPNPLPHRL